jgi:hypothetical protein
MAPGRLAKNAKDLEALGGRPQGLPSRGSAPASRPFFKFFHHSSANPSKGVENILFPGNKKVRFLQIY